MKKYILAEPKKIEVEECPQPLPGDDEVLVRVKNIGICGSDIHLYAGTYQAPHRYPMLFGHEWSGIVEAAGKNVTHVKSGDYVTGDCSRYCGICENCKTDKNLCKSIEKFGITVDGASSEYIVRDARYIYKAPEGSDLTLLSLTEPMAVAANMITKIKRLGDIKNKKILVYGGGAIGIAVLMLLKLKEKCRDVSVFDLFDYRNKLAESIGANIPDATDLNTSAGVDYTSMYTVAKYDIIIETTGSAEVFSKTIHLVKPGGIVGCVGMIAKAKIEQKLIVTKALTIMGAIGGTGEFETIMQFFLEHGPVARQLISHKFNMEQVQEAFDITEEKKSIMKIILQL